MQPVIGFDMDGVILHSDNLDEGGWIVDAFMRTLRKFNIPETEENARLLYISNLRNNAAAFCRKFGIPDANQLWDRRDKNYIRGKLTALNAGEIELYPDVDALRQLARVYPLAMVSNSPQLIVDEVVSRFSLEPLFPIAIGRGTTLSELRFAKPAPDMLERMKKAVGAKSGCYVGDQPEDAQAARAAKLIPITISRDGENGDIRTLTELEQIIKRLNLACVNPAE
jgi:phosphoglycolate phosphatase-like HAD superfamily hydrolase